MCPAFRDGISPWTAWILEQARQRPESLVQETPVTLDEVQREPGLLSATKNKVDEDRRPGMFLLTGSANLSLMERVSESLAGRAAYLELPPFCPVEWLSGDEVDFVLENHGRIVALEIKASDTVRTKDAEGLAAFRAAMGGRKVARSVVLHGGQEARPLDGDCHALPRGWMLPEQPPGS